MSLHCHGQWLQFGRDGGEQGWRKERREHDSSVRVNGEVERLMDLVGMRGKCEVEGQVVLWGFGGVGERKMEEELGL